MPLLPVRLQGHTKQVSSVTFFNDGQHVVTCSLDRTLRVWDVQKKTLVGRPFKGHTGDILSVAVSPDDRRIASCGEDETIIIWDVKSRRKVSGPLMKHADWVHSVCFSPDGKNLASGSDDTTVIVWNTEIPGAITSTLKGHLESVLSVAFSPDGQKIVSGSSDRTVRVWRVHNADLLFDIHAHSDWVRSVVWSPDDRQLVSASNDNTIRFWDARTGLQIDQPCTGHNTSVCSLAMSFDSSFIASASLDKTVRLWSMENHKEIEPAFEHSSRVYCVSISPNGALLASGGRDGSVYLWSIPDWLQRLFIEDLTKHIIKTENYPVACGEFADIWKCAYLAEERPIDVAVKLYGTRFTYTDGADERTNKRMQRELATRARLKHPNIIALHGYTRGFGPRVAIVSPWAENGDLTSYLEHSGVILPLNRRFDILRDITAGLQYLHSNKIIHGDLTSTNVLIHGDGTASLAGFGLCREVGQASWTPRFHRTLRWVAPELFDQSDDDAPVQPSERSDIYSFGGIMLHVITGKVPYYYYISNLTIIHHVTTGVKPSRSRYPAFSDKYWHFIERCWSTSPQDRPSAQEVVELIRGEFDSLAANVVPMSPTDIKEVKARTGDEEEESDEDTGFYDVLASPTEIEEVKARTGVEEEESDEDTHLFGVPNLTRHITKIGDSPVAGGGYGQIWRCKYSTDQGPILVAVKSLLSYMEDQQGGAFQKKTKRIRRELRIWARLKHPNIIAVYGYTHGFGLFVAIVSPWAENGNLTAYLKRKDITFTPLRRFEILRDIAAGLEHLHANKVVHGDLTGPNVLIHGNGTACLADFGLSLMYSEEISISQASCSSTFRGTLRWLDPDLLGNMGDISAVKRTMHSDMYSFGGIMLQVLTGEIPYHNLGNMEVFRCVYDRIKPMRICYPPVPDKHWDFVTACWSDIETRPTASRAVEWIKDEFDLLPTSSTTVT